MSLSRFVLLVPLLILVSSCSTTSKRSEGDPRAAFQQICSRPDEIDQVSGSVWVKIDSPRGKGQFPANVLYDRLPSPKLVLQVTDLIGTPLSEMTVDDQGLRVVGQGSDIDWIKKSIETQSLLGLKPKTLISLFAGKPICPAQVERVHWADGELIADVNRTISYRYGVVSWGGRLLVSSLSVTGLRVEFMDPEDPIGLPKQMHGESAQGSIKVRWRDRKLQLKPKTPN